MNSRGTVLSIGASVCLDVCHIRNWCVVVLAIKNRN